MKKLVLVLVAIMSVCSSVELQAQLQTPAPSPMAKLTQMVGLTEVTIEYSRPGVKGREIFAENGLVPYDKVWRTGANAATRFSFSEDVTLGGEALEAGEYAVLTKPGAEQWEVMLFPYESSNWGSYVDKDPAAKFMAEPQAMDVMVESFLIDLNNLRSGSANIIMAWANTMVPIPLEVPTDEQVSAQIERVMGGPTAGDYYAAGSYYFETGKDMDKALKWVQKANKMQPRFWTMRTEALILAEMGKEKEAIATAQKSMEMAEKAGNEDYVRMNKKSIAEWKGGM